MTKHQIVNDFVLVYLFAWICLLNFIAAIIGVIRKEGTRLNCLFAVGCGVASMILLDYVLYYVVGH